MRAIALGAFLLMSVTAAWGVTIDFGGAIPRGVAVTKTGVWLAGGVATFHNGPASRMTIRFQVPRGTDTSRWKLRIADRGASTAGGPIYVRPDVTVNGRAAASYLVLRSTFESSTHDVGRLLRPGSNQLDITLGADSTSGYQLRSISIGP